MKTTKMFNHLSARSLRFGIAAIAVLIAASSFAGTTKNAPKASVQYRRVAARQFCYVQLSNSSFPQPCERIRGLASTAAPMDIIGEVPMIRVVRK